MLAGARCFQVQCGQGTSELDIQRRFDVDAAAFDRMFKSQPPGMQQHAVDAEHAEDAVVATVAVAGIADQVVADVLEVAANLPVAAGFRQAFE